MKYKLRISEGTMKPGFFQVCYYANDQWNIHETNPEIPTFDEAVLAARLYLKDGRHVRVFRYVPHQVFDSEIDLPKRERSDP